MRKVWLFSAISTSWHVGRNARNGAPYEYHHHAPDFLAAGGSQSTLDALIAFLNSDQSASNYGLIGNDALVVRYAVQVTRNGRVDDALFAEMTREFDTTELVELTAAIATYNMVARFLLALDVKPEQ